MTRINKISLYQYRNYNTADFELKNLITCIVGANGSGKTNLLDAVYLLCYTKSYFSPNTQSIVAHGAEAFRITGSFTHNAVDAEVCLKWKNAKKELSENGLIYEKTTEHIGKYSAVMIAPDDIELINEGSELRRKWIDSILCQTNRDYLNRLMHYQKILLQRNAWLKLQNSNSNPNFREIDYYNGELHNDGCYIFEERRKFLELFIPVVNSYFNLIVSGKETITINYLSDLRQESLINLLAQSLQTDMILQRTSKGIHKDELEFRLNGFALKLVGSQGQKKSFLFALKLAQFAFLSEVQGRKPILLLDDVFEKLDGQRMESILKIIRQETFGQVLLTDTQKDRIQDAFGRTFLLDFISL